MKRTLLFIACVLAALTMSAQEYYPEGTKWTEIRLDTLKYDSWYSKVGDEWVPNFETIEYYVKGEYTTEYGEKYKCVYTNGPEWTDSLMLGIQEGEYNVIVTAFVYDYDGVCGPSGWAPTYQFDWSVGKGIYFKDLSMSNTTYLVQYECYYGIIDEIKEGYFGGVRPLKYVDLDGKAPECSKYDNPQKVDTQGGRIIQGIGITEWNDGECLFGPPGPYDLISMESMYNEYSERHYRSMLVHFERNGEVLYDVWPESSPQMAYHPFVEDGKVWVVKAISSWPEEEWIEYYYFDGDTIIDGLSAKRMLVDSVHFTELENTYREYVGAFYEKDKKVYGVLDYQRLFELLYDFTLSSGDSIQIDENYMVPVYKRSGGITGFKGSYYDIVYSEYIVEHWLEGVGSEYYPWLNLRMIWGGKKGILLACFVGDEVIYYNSEEGDPYVMGARRRRFDFTHTTKIQPKSRIRNGEEEAIFGEYNDQQLCINLDPLDETYQVRITDESGKTVYEKNINAGDIVGLNIDISAYPEGRYTVTVENSQETFTGEFEAQTTGIEVVRNKKEVVDDHIYNLQGQRLSTPPSKGIYIRNGKKIVF